MMDEEYCAFRVPGKGGVDGLQPHDWRLHVEIVGHARYRCWYCTRCRKTAGALVPELERVSERRAGR